MSDLLGLGVIAAIIVVFGVIIWIVSNTTTPVTPAEPTGIELGAADEVKGMDDTSAMPPIGWTLIVIGMAGELWAWFGMDVTPYGDVVNIDAVSQRGMLLDSSLATTVVGFVLLGAGRVINEIRRGR